MVFVEADWWKRVKCSSWLLGNRKSLSYKESGVVWTNKEKCLIVEVSSFALKQDFHYALSSRVGEEGLMLEVRDKFRGNDDRI